MHRPSCTRRLPLAFSLLLTACRCLAASEDQAQESPLIAEAPAASGWRFERLETEPGAAARLHAPSGATVRLEGLPADVPVDLVASADRAALALLVHHRKYTDLLAWRQNSAGELVEEVLPILPAAEILRSYPTGGKPPALRKPRLAGMSIERAGWGTGRRLAARVRLLLVDDATGETGWSYLVDAVWSMPPVTSPPGARAVLTLLNVILEPPC
ncbi:MAG: hypothetical protein JSR82_08055 [Verrucomicrobia bacterium]|nr:hypothetical protein [Verrucomicrobiota bacterium]